MNKELIRQKYQMFFFTSHRTSFRCNFSSAAHPAFCASSVRIDRLFKKKKSFRWFISELKVLCLSFNPERETLLWVLQPKPSESSMVTFTLVDPCSSLKLWAPTEP